MEDFDGENMFYPIPVSMPGGSRFEKNYEQVDEKKRFLPVDNVCFTGTQYRTYKRFHKKPTPTKFRFLDRISSGFRKSSPVFEPLIVSNTNWSRSKFAPLKINRIINHLINVTSITDKVFLKELAHFLVEYKSDRDGNIAVILGKKANLNISDKEIFIRAMMRHGFKFRFKGMSVKRPACVFGH